MTGQSEQGNGFSITAAKTCPPIIRMDKTSLGQVELWVKKGVIKYFKIIHIVSQALGISVNVCL